MAVFKLRSSADAPADDDHAAQPAFGLTAVRALIETRLNPHASYERLKDAGVHPYLAARYLDLAMCVAARRLFTDPERVIWSTHYRPVDEIPALTNEFARCVIVDELNRVYDYVPTAVAILAPLSKEVVEINELLPQAPPEARIRMPEPVVGDASQAGYPWKTFGPTKLTELAEHFPPLEH